MRWATVPYSVPAPVATTSISAVPARTVATIWKWGRGPVELSDPSHTGLQEMLPSGGELRYVDGARFLVEGLGAG